MVGIISVVIGDHFGGGDHFDGGDHFGGGTESVLWPNRERRTCARTNVETSRYCIGLQLFVQLAPNTTVGDAVIRTGLAKRNSSSNGDKY